MDLTSTTMGPAYTYSIRLRDIKDGDTITADVDLGMKTWQRDVTIRLFGIDTPELRPRKNKPDGTPRAEEDRSREKRAAAAAKAMVGESLTLATHIVIESKEMDNFGRLLAVVWYSTDGESYTNLCEELVRGGYAERYE